MWLVGDRDEDNGYKNVSCLVLFRLSRLRTRDGGSNVGSFVSSCLWTVRLSGSEETVRVGVGAFVMRTMVRVVDGVVMSSFVLFRLSRFRTRCVGDGGGDECRFECRFVRVVVSSCLWTVRLSGSEETVLLRLSLGSKRGLVA